MPRSTKKGPFIDKHLFDKAMDALSQEGAAKPIKTYSRRSCIIPEFVGLTFLVYFGKLFVPVYVRKQMIGMKLGDFVMTRTFRAHAGDKKTK